MARGAILRVKRILDDEQPGGVGGDYFKVNRTNAKTTPLAEVVVTSRGEFKR